MLSRQSSTARRFHFIQVDVFTSERLRGNALSVFTDARGLSHTEMQDLARETNLQETTFVLPSDAATDPERGVNIRIFTPEQELPFAGHPVLGTATVLRMLQLESGNAKQNAAPVSTVVLNLTAGRISVSFYQNAEHLFGEMIQIPPIFGPILDRNEIVELLGFDVGEIEAELPIETVSTGLPFAIVPVRRLATLQSLRFSFRRVYQYLAQHQVPARNFYFVTRDTGDPKVGLRARSIYLNGEDPATGSAAGCASAWMVKYGVAQPDETVLIRQGVEINRPSDLFVRSSKSGTTISNVRVGGYTVPIMEGEAFL